MCTTWIIFLKVYKIKTVLSLHAPVVFKLFVGLLRKILNVKILIASMKRRANSAIGQFSLHDHLLLDRGKVGLKYTCHGRFTEHFLESQTGSGASFTVTVFLNAATSSLKRVTGRILKINKCFQRRM